MSLEKRRLVERLSTKAASEVKLPRLAEGHDVSIIAPAEVEL